MTAWNAPNTKDDFHGKTFSSFAFKTFVNLDGVQCGISGNVKCQESISRSCGKDENNQAQISAAGNQILTSFSNLNTVRNPNSTFRIFTNYPKMFTYQIDSINAAAATVGSEMVSFTQTFAPVKDTNSQGQAIMGIFSSVLGVLSGGALSSGESRLSIQIQKRAAKRFSSFQCYQSFWWYVSNAYVEIR